VYEVVVASLSHAFSFNELLRVLERVFTQKTIVVVRATLPIDTTGRTYHLTDVILIQINADIDDNHALLVSLHEIGHILFNHVQKTDLTYREFALAEQAGRISDLPVVHRKLATLYDKPQEHAAEAIADLFIECVTNYETSMPLLAQDLYE
jgi:hypothetical protein